MRCPGSVERESTQPDKSFAFAEEGTHAHEKAEQILNALLMGSEDTIFADVEMYKYV
ncbi:DUF2800 domain-containing protein [Klebsiella michiganensis]|uniref:DUF2800 domain-containing protein n=1 Tax=Klebsiella michiganensis TaxID=1134687 RepID=UPI001CC9A550|nr:DUF2800 domain-containing protein [Klebsiella michiganensis]MDK3152784.1 DUF2800 domain-containing protein [Klebsiella michiganensis]MDU4389173.1 DUF2800 domain-containing protein [Klebsiella michiganensis]MDV1378696.1 DUF2800 domain-containing protein [Klebsiella michiganensis]MDV1432913.1 DUF2800 domain-containing protein [Klebsiella michiganensis]MDV1949873.1 DUF2800 domain-containing protein [Klebsiella michiganensis]